MLQIKVNIAPNLNDFKNANKKVEKYMMCGLRMEENL